MITFVKFHNKNQLAIQAIITMCLILFAHRTSPGYRLILAANRDEFLDRPAAPLHYWSDNPSILAGRDQRAGGTWLGMDTSGRFAALTNYRDPSSANPSAPSRGDIITSYLESRLSGDAFLDTFRNTAQNYNGFNLLVADRENLFWYSNRTDRYLKLGPGIYGLSNHLLDTPWPKVVLGKDCLKTALAGSGPIDGDSLFKILQNREIPDDSLLPHTGIGIEWERVLSSIFITSPSYGTRSSTVLTMEESGGARIIERTFTPMETRSYEQIDFTV